MPPVHELTHDASFVRIYYYIKYNYNNTRGVSNLSSFDL